MSVVVAAAAPALSDSAREWVTAATAYVRFAGPDGAGVALGDGCGLGQALLQTSPRDTAGPLTLDGRTWISADVRLDDRAGLVGALHATGRDVDGESEDAALVLAAYERWSDGFLARLRGDFAFALWDARRRRLICARDQIGVVPLHYALAGDQLLVSSALDALLLHEGVADDLDEAAVAGFLLTGHAPSFTGTAFAAVRRLAPAHCLVYSEGRLAVRRYWEPPELEPLLHMRRPADYVARFGNCLGTAVADRATSDRLAVQVSGGMDSTSVAALARQVLDRRGVPGEALRGVTATLGAASGDEEGRFAALVAGELGVGLEVVDDSELAPTDPFAPPTPLTPEPTPYRWTGLEYRVAAVSAEHARVCLSGLGGDPLLAHVPWYWARWLAGGHLLRLGLSIAEHRRLFGQMPRPHLGACLAHVRRSLRPAPARAPAWLSPRLAESAVVAEQLRLMTRLPDWTWDQRALTRDPLWQTWFVWGDPTYSRLPLRVRHPFVDLRLLELVGRLPPDPWFARKLILRAATEELLPAQVVRRDKTPLVDAGRAGTAPQDLGRLVELVRAVPAADAFVDRGVLMDALVDRSAAIPALELALSPAFGLISWLHHWGRPRGKELGQPSGVSITYIEGGIT